MAAALVAALWIAYFTRGDSSPAALAGLAAGTFLSTSAGLFLRGVIRDLAAREKIAARQAGHDLLSGLANRKLFAQWLEYELARRRREDARFALMYLDIDHFKDINDRHGHDAGDRMIASVAKRISATLRPTDRLARFGGDEFAILQTGVRTMRDAEALATRIVEAMRASFDLGRLEIVSSVSIGIALCPDNASEGDDLMKLADLALYRAKKEGRNRFAFFDSRMGEELARRNAFSAELSDAIEGDALQLDYQPVFTAGDRRLVCAEARLRWPHPHRGIIESREFTNVAEERGLLLPLGEWMLRRACLDANAWNGARVCVNVSPIQFAHHDFAAHVLRVLQDTGLDPGALDIALSEESILRPKAHAIAGMTTLRNEGVRFTLADYGSGVASIDYIRRFPFSRIKLDRSRTEPAPGMTENAAVLHAVIHLGRAIGLTITADGVQEDEQLRYLTALGCHEVQGRLLSRYVSGDEIARIAAEGPSNAAAAD